MALGLAVAGCEHPTRYLPSEYEVVTGANQVTLLTGADTLLTVSSLKWPQGSAAAVSITYDAPWGTHADHHLATDAVIARGLHMDLEMVTWIYTQPALHHWLSVYQEELVPNGVHFFGHGHTHALHDTMEYDDAYASFRLCYDLMTNWGFNPKAYAYPGSSGLRPSTQAANRAAGFICARGDAKSESEYYIVPDSTREPANWFFLPSVVMGNASYRYVDVHEKLVPILNEAVAHTAWVILMYHAIGIPEGWSYYPLADFEQDLEAMQERSMWSGNMDEVACYVRERAALRFELVGVESNERGGACQIRLDDGLPDNVYDVPLSFEVRSRVGDLELSRLDATAPTASGAVLRFDALPEGSTFVLRWGQP